jgi:hypothetical protein
MAESESFKASKQPTEAHWILRTDIPSRVPRGSTAIEFNVSFRFVGSFLIILLAGANQIFEYRDRCFPRLIIPPHFLTPVPSVFISGIVGQLISLHVQVIQSQASQPQGRLLFLPNYLGPRNF